MKKPTMRYDELLEEISMHVVLVPNNPWRKCQSFQEGPTGRKMIDREILFKILSKAKNHYLEEPKWNPRKKA